MAHTHQVPNGEFTTEGIQSQINPNMHYHVYNNQRTGDALAGVGHFHEFEDSITGPALELEYD